MPEDVFIPRPTGFLYQHKNTGKEVVLLYDENVWLWDTRPGAENMIPGVIYVEEAEIDEDLSVERYDEICYPKHLWEESYEPVPVSINLWDEGETNRCD